MENNEKRNGMDSPQTVEGNSVLKSDLVKQVVKLVRTGALAASVAAGMLNSLGCGARTGLPTDDVTFVDVDTDNPDAGANGGCMGVDAGSCMGVDAGSCMGVDAGSCMGVDAGSCMGIDG